MSQQQQRELIEKISLQPSGKDVQRVSENGGQKDCKENSKYEEDHQSQSEDNSQDVVVPITIKPGHILFGSSKEVAVDQVKQQDQIPVEGDVIAYRVIELSSSWTPETSSYRVGRVSWYDPQSNRIIIVLGNDECSGIQSLYGEDGSLEADYSSLLEVRSMEQGCLKSEKSVSKEVKQVLVQDQDAGTYLKTTSNKEAVRCSSE